MNTVFGKKRVVTDRVRKLRFESKYKKSGSRKCWNWLGATTDSGKLLYGMFRWGSRMELAHRISYRLYVGEIPSGMMVLHSCDNGLCVNPSHLFIGTQQDNMRDMSRKMRGRPAGYPQKTCMCTNAGT